MRLLNSFRIEVLLIVVLSGMALWQLGGAAYIHAKARFAQYLMERAWSQTTSAQARITPWPWADTWPVAKLEIPRLHQSLMVLSDATGRSLAFGPGVLQRDALHRPNATPVIAGHRDTHFAVLRELRVGDRLILQKADRSTQPYQVTSMRIIDLRREMLMISDDQSELILSTCYPFDAVDPGGTQRFVVFAKPLVAVMGRVVI